MPLHVSPQLWWLIVPLFAWRIVVRLYRLLARQRYSPFVVWARVGTLGLLTAAIAVLAAGQGISIILLSCGLAAGSALGVWGVSMTQFEACEDGLYYQPNRYLGLGLSVLLLARVVWRLVAGPEHDSTGWTPTEFARNPSTLLLYGLFSGHYLAYALGLRYRAGARIVLDGSREL
jgi:hypothetical protein